MHRLALILCLAFPLVAGTATGGEAPGLAAAGDSLVCIRFQGRGGKVSVASELNGWNPDSGRMHRVAGTDSFSLEISVPSSARFEYKLVVDSAWILDPFNPRRAPGGFGPNSEIRMPGYVPPRHANYDPAIPHGKIDTLSFASRKLGRTHHVFVYLPPGYATGTKKYPAIFVTDGGEYLSLGSFNNVLDNLIASGIIMPVIGVFADPRTDPQKSDTRMDDYTMSDTFVAFLADELRGMIVERYRTSGAPESTAVLGASLGGLISTYTAFRRPDVFGLCAAQSPSYWWKDDAMISLADSLPARTLKIYIDSGTLRDASDHTRLMRDVLVGKGYTLHYEEHPEGHNWMNWRARIETILQYFFGQ